jgi:membrane associated rhomboid family serine protease
MGRWYSAPEERPRVQFAVPHGCPATYVLMGIAGFSYLTMHLGWRSFWEALVFTADTFPAQPWRLLTYPLVNCFCSFGNFILSLLWLWFIGGSLERLWGTRFYLLFFFAAAALSALTVWMGGLVVFGSILLSMPPLAGFLIPEAALTVAWAVLNAEAVVLFAFIFPLRAKWIAWISVAIVFFAYPFPWGLFALSGCLAAWWYTRNMTGYTWSSGWRGRPIPEPTPVKKSWRVRWNEINPFERYTRWKRKRDFARLMRNSGFLEFEEEEEERRGRKGK